MPNQLINEKSLYLLQHANNPVDWHSWNKETLSKAVESDKLLLVSIGYATCHWCHVMEKECFEDLEVATMMNANFVCIKVDREELPDVDQYFMNALQLLGRHGGWPLNAIALPDGRFVWGGTYFPKQNWMNILQQLSLLFLKDRIRMTEQAAQIDVHLRNIRKPKTGETKFSFESILKNIGTRLDYENGGIVGAPKFPMPSILLLLQEINYFFPDQKTSNFLDVTLLKMAQGGIYDQIGGGFMRYATDEKWRIPHFEKMLYDNAQLLSVYANACLLNPNPLYSMIMDQCVSFLLREMKHPEGGFFSAIDADCEGEEGLYYCWTKGEIEESFDKDECKLIFDFFDFDERSHWENGMYILIPDDDTAFAQKIGLETKNWGEKKQKIKEKLFDLRQKRTRPSTDSKRLTSWNALLIYALIQVYKSCGNRSALDAAQHGLKFIDIFRVKEGIMLRHSDTRTEVFLEDYATVIRAWIAFFEISGERKWIDEAEEMNRTAFSLFGDTSETFLFETLESSLVPVREKSFYDQVTPSSNALMTENLIKLHLLTNNASYKKMYERLLNEMAEPATSYPEAFAYWLRLLAEKKSGLYTLVTTGSGAKEKNLELQKKFLPGFVFAFATKAKDTLPVFWGYDYPENATIHICGDGFCLQPIEKSEDALEMIKKIRTNQ